ncbi:hypothetical protein ACOCJ5_07710 [Knoellia sp. CPCC 206450]|uniref:hypothetical protein n=1 Tax=Knoellia tibetensis TaxID=3404798 RepID=UPI003B43403C
MAKHLANETLQTTMVGDLTSEEHAEIAFLTAKARTIYNAAQVPPFETGPSELTVLGAPASDSSGPPCGRIAAL